MQIVIEIPDEVYKAYKLDFNLSFLNSDQQSFARGCLINGLLNGTPLPKGHGRLIDADKTALLSNLFCYTKYTGIDEAPYEDATKALEFAPTIIEADKEYEAEVITRGKCMMCGKELTEGLFFCKECGDKANSGK